MTTQQESQGGTQQSTGNFTIQNRMTFYGPVFMLFIPFTGVGLFVFGVFSFTHWPALVAMSGSIVAWCLFLAAAVAITGVSWGASKVLLMLAHSSVELYRHVAETRIQVNRDKTVLVREQNYVVLLIDRKPQLIAVPTEKHTYSHRAGHTEIEEIDTEPDAASTPALPPPSQLPTQVRYEDIRRQIAPGQALVGISEKGIETRDRSIRALIWVVGGSGTGKTNSVSIRVEEDFQRGSMFLVIDPHAFKDDSLYNAVKGYSARFLAPMAQETADIIGVLDYFLEEFLRRKAGGKWQYPITILVDEVGSLTGYVETEEEEELVKKLKEVARICGQESRGFDMCGVFISQDAAGLAWLRKRAIMVLAHQVTMWSERILVCNNDTKLARAMDNWPKGRTLVYGIAFTSGPLILQQPLFSPARMVDADKRYTPYMEPLRPNTLKVQEKGRTDEPPAPDTEPGLQNALDAWNSGATGVRPLMRSLGVTYYKASQLFQEMKEKGLIQVTD